MFKINGVQMPEPALGGVTITDESIWDEKAGRSASGKFIGKIVAHKRTVEVTWPPLSFSQSQALRNAIRNGGDTFTIEYNDFSGTSTTGPVTVYAGSVPRTLYSIAAGHRRHTGVAISFIEV